MAILRQRKQSLPLWYLATALMVVSVGCCSRKRVTEANAAACTNLANTVAAQERAFVVRVRAIREQHVLIQDYDREMIAAITERRAALQATTLTEMSVTDEIAGCSGKQLDDLRRRAQQELVNLRAYLNDFNRALRTDPQGVFIDQY